MSMSNDIVLFGANGKPLLNIGEVQKQHDEAVKKLMWLRNNAEVECPICHKTGRVIANMWNSTLTCSNVDCHQAFELTRGTKLKGKDGEVIRRFPSDLGMSYG